MIVLFNPDIPYTLHNNTHPSMVNWLCANYDISHMPYSLIFSTKETSVELWISRASTDINTMAPNRLEQSRVSVEEVSRKPRLQQLAAVQAAHVEKRNTVMDGRAMIAAMSHETCVRIGRYVKIFAQD